MFFKTKNKEGKAKDSKIQQLKVSLTRDSQAWTGPAESTANKLVKDCSHLKKWRRRETDFSLL